MTGCKAACHICGADGWWVSEQEHKRHVKSCEAIMLGLLGNQVSPVVETEDGQPPPGFQWI